MEADLAAGSVSELASEGSTFAIIPDLLLDDGEDRGHRCQVDTTDAVTTFGTLPSPANTSSSTATTAASACAAAPWAVGQPLSAASLRGRLPASPTRGCGEPAREVVFFGWDSGGDDGDDDEQQGAACSSSSSSFAPSQAHLRGGAGPLPHTSTTPQGYPQWAHPLGEAHRAPTPRSAAFSAPSGARRDNRPWSATPPHGPPTCGPVRRSPREWKAAGCQAWCFEGTDTSLASAASAPPPGHRARPLVQAPVDVTCQASTRRADEAFSANCAHAAADRGPPLMRPFTPPSASRLLMRTWQRHLLERACDARPSSGSPLLVPRSPAPAPPGSPASPANPRRVRRPNTCPSHGSAGAGDARGSSCSTGSGGQQGAAVAPAAVPVAGVPRNFRRPGVCPSCGSGIGGGGRVSAASGTETGAEAGCSCGGDSICDLCLFRAQQRIRAAASGVAAADAAARAPAAVVAPSAVAYPALLVGIC
mmetsp:Transcript_91147/g.294499  ORF Transcript_91147/g.294499 Transcript_91147/m.294499 type:complete len:477 (-) Transcript_91147:126-1556(-)